MIFNELAPPLGTLVPKLLHIMAKGSLVSFFIFGGTENGVYIGIKTSNEITNSNFGLSMSLLSNGTETRIILLKDEDQHFLARFKT